MHTYKQENNNNNNIIKKQVAALFVCLYIVGIDE